MYFKIITHYFPLPPKLQNKPRYKPSNIQILCIYHQNKTRGSMEQMDTLKHIAETLNTRKIHTTIAPPTLPNTQVNRIKKWSSLQNRPSITHNHFYNPPPLPTYQHNTPKNLIPDIAITQMDPSNPPWKKAQQLDPRRNRIWHLQSRNKS